MNGTVVASGVIGVLVGVVIGGLVVALILTRAAARERRDATSIDDLLKPVRESIEGLRRASDLSSHDRTQAEATLAAQMAAVQERYQSLETSTKLLAGALSRGQTRGQWGEMQLEGLLTHSGLIEGTNFRRQDSRTGAEGNRRPDIVVLLPGGAEILVDAKFPFDAYWQAVSSDDPSTRDEFMRRHAGDLLSRAKELASKRYADADTSPDFVVMFLPLESLLSAALEADGLLLERTFNLRVVLATPTTMLALLRTIGFGYQRQLMADNAEDIRKAGAEMLSRLGTLAEHLDGMRRGLDHAVQGYNKFVGSFDSQAMRQARRLSELGVTSSRTLESPGPIDAALRESSPASLRE